MASKTEICNYALVIHLGAEEIDDYASDNSSLGRKCRQIYPIILKSLIEEHPWQFAKKSIVLNLLTEEPIEWQYAYQWPGDCLKPREIYRSSKSSLPVDYEVLSNEDKNGRIIATDEQTAYMIYTAYIDNVAMYPNYFQLALSIRLALALCATVNASEKKKNKLYAEDNLIVSNAKGLDAQTKSNNVEPDCEFLTSRL